MVQEVRPSFSTLLDSLPPGNIIRGVEIGVFRGQNARRMLESCDRLKLYLVDIKEQPEIKELLEEYKNRVKFILNSSVAASKDFVNEFFDYIYIDADHSYENVDRDIRAWYPKLKPKGRLAGHDFGRVDVNRAVLGFVNETNKHICIEKLDWWLK